MLPGNIGQSIATIFTYAFYVGCSATSAILQADLPLTDRAGKTHLSRCGSEIADRIAWGNWWPTKIERMEETKIWSMFWATSIFRPESRIQNPLPL